MRLWRRLVNLARGESRRQACASSRGGTCRGDEMARRRGSRAREGRSRVESRRVGKGRLESAVDTVNLHRGVRTSFEHAGGRRVTPTAPERARWNTSLADLRRRRRPTDRRARRAASGRRRSDNRVLWWLPDHHADRHVLPSSSLLQLCHEPRLVVSNSRVIEWVVGGLDSRTRWKVVPFRPVERASEASASHALGFIAVIEDPANEIRDPEKEERGQ